MRKSPTKRVEPYRVATGQYASEPGGNCGAFIVPFNGVALKVISSDGSDWSEAGLPGTPWEHVSVSVQVRTPTWAEMDFIKRQFWDDSETVLQLHVARKDHINTNEFTLHMWRPVGQDVPVPPKVCV